MCYFLLILFNGFLLKNLKLLKWLKLTSINDWNLWKVEHEPKIINFGSNLEKNETIENWNEILWIWNTQKVEHRPKINLEFIFGTNVKNLKQ